MTTAIQDEIVINQPDNTPKHDISDDNNSLNKSSDPDEKLNQYFNPEVLSRDNNLFVQNHNKIIFGKTSDNKIFPIPKTNDMVQTLFNPFIKKSLIDILNVILLSLNLIFLFFFEKFFDFNPNFKIYFFTFFYVFWRFSYNLGIGYLLYNQSNYNFITDYFVKKNLFNYNYKDTPDNFIQSFIRSQLRTKIGNNYNLSEHPIEFNSWILFRHLVDLILMQDFTVYCCLVYSVYSNLNTNLFESTLLDFFRLVIGISFILFNIWVKVDAHNIVKDYAWYWGDFFFLQVNNHLIFNGVFNMFPHPMYSIGYIGYYGFALLTKSYLILFISIFAHLLQFFFLYSVEEPHINKIYGEPISISSIQINNIDNKIFKVKPLLIFSNFKIIRPNDSLTVLIISLLSLLSFNSINNNFQLFLITLSAKCFFSILIFYILSNQSKNQSYSRIYLKYDFTLNDAFNDWCVFYNLGHLVVYTLTFVLAFKELFYNNITTTNNNNNNSNNLMDFPLRLTIGVFFIILNLICNKSIINTLGLFGWFYGDFFLPLSNFSQPNLTRSGIYRYLNNPERLLGILAIWGLTIITWSPFFFILAMVWTLNQILLIKFVEEPHMIKLYGEQQVSQDSGVSTEFKKILPKIDVFEKIRTYSMSQDLNKNPSSQIKSEIQKNNKKNNKSIINNNSKNYDHDTDIDNDFSDIIDKKLFISKSKDEEYSIEFLNMKVNPTSKSLYINVGEPIVIKYKIPIEHDIKDWIGLYKIISTSKSKQKTMIPSNGHWIPVLKDSYKNKKNEKISNSLGVLIDNIIEEANDEKKKYKIGYLKFYNEFLYFEKGVYELRYHRDSSHSVLVISKPFEIKIKKIEIPGNKFNLIQHKDFEKIEDEDINKFQRDILKLLQNLFVTENEKIDISNVIESDYLLNFNNQNFIELIEQIINTNNLIYDSDEIREKLDKFLKKMSNLIEDSTNIEISNEVLIKDKTLNNLCNRLIVIKKVLNDLSK
ncbi:phosphatidylethanolamine N-methyltransferase ASCRUDRAFT_75436 [Ascoidea rubescens DSM 1968]|uniref:Phosphatidylethanolamine N-methyltransferase n=1 Tax=Ascoidea rubescens DSM 1968 TaxID=1344418 RepID=A0A1D2VIS8_9ASCO|nr:hypothetical protein ASCRUDRAFT_75436 [Ascoidea rubescens DSM 1968]ODV61413.1 hypothetical protein ASCRUDRAFT_75436 [Ascoidea rubescens DSM 1968]